MSIINFHIGISLPNLRVKFNFLKKKYNNYNNISLVNQAVGEKKTKKTLNIAGHSGNSSFFGIKKDSDWLNLRSEQLGINKDNYITKKIEVNLDTVDSYCSTNSINNINIMKIDTQLYEQQVLMGCENMIKNQKIDAIEIEIVFSSVYEKYVNFMSEHHRSSSEMPLRDVVPYTIILCDHHIQSSSMIIIYNEHI